MSSFTIIAFYKFVNLPDFAAMRSGLLSTCLENKVKGTVLLAQEGLNGTLAGPERGIQAVLAYFNKDERLQHMVVKTSYADENPFYRTKVKLKKEIVTLGVDGIDPVKQVGEYVKPEQWNELISDPDVIVVDTRNAYEVGIGTFKNAIDPETESFREFPDYVKTQLANAKDKKIAMFCTGGIRCEKATAYMLQQGFDQVYHLEGGILKYLEQVKPQDSLWEGECFVFDNRVTVDHALNKGNYDQCYACRMPITEQDKHSEHYQPGISCPHCHDKTSQEQKSRFVERQKQIDLAKAHNREHIAAPAKQPKLRR